jgi:hypothetical protein
MSAAEQRSPQHADDAIADASDAGAGSLRLVLESATAAAAAAGTNRQAVSHPCTLS